MFLIQVKESQHFSHIKEKTHCPLFLMHFATGFQLPACELS